MDTYNSLRTQLYEVNSNLFDELALRVFRYQYHNNLIYKGYVDAIGVNLDQVTRIAQIPFLPISFFKTQDVKTEVWDAQMVFESSGTTGVSTSRHFVYDTEYYVNGAVRTFEDRFGPLSDYNILAVLPSYTDRPNSSLIFMVDHFIARSKSAYSGYYTADIKRLREVIEASASRSRRCLLWGVTFALLQLAEMGTLPNEELLLIETGGMKGRGKELVRSELHQILKSKLGVKEIVAEYGMTELLSQAYTTSETGKFQPARTMKVLAREIADPFNVDIRDTGALNIIDLANLHSIAFIETEDLGTVHPDGSFEVLGRMDNADLRGCNLLIS